MLCAYDWPGNVRELKHCIERMTALHSATAPAIYDLPSAIQNFGLRQLSHSVLQPAQGELADDPDSRPFPRSSLWGKANCRRSARPSGHQWRALQSRRSSPDQPHHAVPENETIRDELTIALDATYSIGEELSGVGLVLGGDSVWTGRRAP